VSQAVSWIKVKIMLAAVFIFCLSLWAYSGTTSNQLVWDSVHFIEMKEDRIANLDTENLYWMFTNVEAYNWHPFTWLSWSLDYQIYGGIKAWGFHLTNNVFHAINGAIFLILTLVLFSLGSSKQQTNPYKTDGYSIIAATLAAALFAVHPQHVESVAWVIERKDLLCQMFMLLSILAYIKYVTCGHENKIKWYLGSLCLFLMALLSKPMAVTLPVILLLLDIHPIRRTYMLKSTISTITQERTSRIILEKIPFLILSLMVVVITVIAQKVDADAVPLDWRVLNAFNSIMLYIGKLLVPMHFSPHYPYFLDPYEKISLVNVLPAIAVLGISFLTMFAWVKKQPAWLISWCIYLVALSPVLGLIQVGGQGAADRYAYFPTLPAYVLVGAGVLSLLRKSRLKSYFAVLLIVLVISFLTLSTKQQVKVWSNPLTLWGQAVDSFPDHVYARNNLALAYMRIGNYEAAAIHFNESKRLQPQDVSLLAPRSLAYLHSGRYEDAMNDLIQLGVVSEANQKLQANQYCIQYNLGWIYAKMGRLDDAYDLFSRVGPESDLNPEAEQWMSWLEGYRKNNDADSLKNDLPSFCQTLIRE
jgi:hypothetical protein